MASDPSEFLSLFNKYRPRTLHDLVGQEHISLTLIKAFEKKRLTQAYLMCGSRGAGKTTTARILAAGFNCKQGMTHSPCGECENCLDILNERCIDIVEIDAASKNGVDDVRDLQQSATTVPSQVRTKFYIIDECHQMSPSAQNALLKILEEPPKHVVFILCTTEPEKLKDTVLSRCQICEFRRITVDKIVGRLQWICEQEKFTAEKEALYSIARSAAGGMRDSIVKLSTAMCDADDGYITEKIVAPIIGNAGMEDCSKLVDAIVTKDVYQVFRIIGGIADASATLQPFYLGLLTYFRNMMALVANPKIAEVLDISQSRAEGLIKQANEIGLSQLIQYNKHILFYSKMIDSIKGRMVLETMCLEMLDIQGTAANSLVGNVSVKQASIATISTKEIMDRLDTRLQKVLEKQAVKYNNDCGFEIRSAQFNKVERMIIEKGKEQIVDVIKNMGGNPTVNILEITQDTISAGELFGG